MFVKKCEVVFKRNFKVILNEPIREKNDQCIATISSGNVERGEIEEAVKNLKLRPTPGMDGITDLQWMYNLI